MELAVTIKVAPGRQLLGRHRSALPALVGSTSGTASASTHARPRRTGTIHNLLQASYTLSFSRFVNPRPMVYASMLPSVVVLERGVCS